VKDREQAAATTLRLQEMLDQATPEDLQPLYSYVYGATAARPTVAELTEELLRSGSHDLRRLVTGKRAEYLDVLQDVAGKMGIKPTPEEDETALEQRILMKLFRDAWQKMSCEDKAPLQRIFEEHGVSEEYLDRILVEGAALDLFPAVAVLVTWNVARILAAVAAQEVGAGLGLFFAEGLGAILLGPVGFLAGGFILLLNLLGPAYRKTIPAVIHIAYLRQKGKCPLPFNK